MTFVRLIALVVLLLAVPQSTGASQVRHCADLAEEIAAGMRKKSSRFTLTIVRPGEEGDRRVVGSCDGKTRRIVMEPKGSGEIVEALAPAVARPKPTEPEAPKPAVPVAAPAPMPAPPAPPPAPATRAPTPAPPPAPRKVAPVAPSTPAPSTPAPSATRKPAPLVVSKDDGALTVRPVDPASPPRRMARDQAESLRTLAVEQGADNRDTLEEFTKHLKISALPDLTSANARLSDFVLVESDHTDPSSTFTMITSNGKVILAERTSWVIGLLPEQHAGYFDLCLLSRDFPEPGATFSDWTVEFDGSRYVKKRREFKGRSCLDRVEFKIAR
jgi:hypothetical protein